MHVPSTGMARLPVGRGNRVEGGERGGESRSYGLIERERRRGRVRRVGGEKREKRGV